MTGPIKYHADIETWKTLNYAQNNLCVMHQRRPNTNLNFDVKIT